MNKLPRMDIAHAKDMPIGVSVARLCPGCNEHTLARKIKQNVTKCSVFQCMHCKYPIVVPGNRIMAVYSESKKEKLKKMIEEIK